MVRVAKVMIDISLHTTRTSPPPVLFPIVLLTESAPQAVASVEDCAIRINWRHGKQKRTKTRSEEAQEKEVVAAVSIAGIGAIVQTCRDAARYL
jgi:hypothetical protein